MLQPREYILWDTNRGTVIKQRFYRIEVHGNTVTSKSDILFSNVDFDYSQFVNERIKSQYKSISKRLQFLCKEWCALLPHNSSSLSTNFSNKFYKYFTFSISRAFHLEGFHLMMKMKQIYHHAINCKFVDVYCVLIVQTLFCILDIPSVLLFLKLLWPCILTLRDSY